MEPPEKLWTKKFILITLANFILFVSFQMLSPTLPKFVLQLGGGNFVAGLIVGIFTISAVAARPYAGLLMDQRGRKGVLAGGFFVFLISVFLYTFAFNVSSLIFLRVVHGIGWGMATTASGTVAADVIPAERRGEGIGYFGMSAVLAMAFAPALGLYVIDKYSFQYMFLLSSVLALIAFLISLSIGFSLGTKPQPIREQITKPSMFEPSSFPTSGVLFFLTFLFGGIVTFIVLHGNSLGIDNVGIFFTAYACVLLIIRPISGKISDRKGTDFVVIPGLILASAGIIVLGLAQDYRFFIASGILFGIGFGSSHPNLQALTIKLAPEERRGSANATFFTAFDLGITAGAVSLGALSAWFGYSTMYLISSLAGLFGLIIYFKLLFGTRGGRVTYDATLHQ